MPDKRLTTYQKRWAYEKYWVMAHSQQHYNALRQLFKGNDWSAEKADLFEAYIREAATISPTTKTLRTAYQHVWGYFKKLATPAERERFCDLECFLETKADSMQDFLVEMTHRYQPAYLISCRLIVEGV